MTMPSYTDLHITTAHIPRTALTDLPFRVQVCVARVVGWEAWARADRGMPPERLGAEFGGPGDWLVLDIGGHTICDGRDVPAAVAGTRSEGPADEDAALAVLQAEP